MTDTTPAKETPVKEDPVEEASTEEASAEEAPVKETSEKKPPAKKMKRYIRTMKIQPESFEITICTTDPPDSTSDSHMFKASNAKFLERALLKITREHAKYKELPTPHEQPSGAKSPGRGDTVTVGVGAPPTRVVRRERVRVIRPAGTARSMFLYVTVTLNLFLAIFLFGVVLNQAELKAKQH